MSYLIVLSACNSASRFLISFGTINHLALHGLGCQMHKTMWFLQTYNDVMSNLTPFSGGPSHFVYFRTCHTKTW